MHAYNKVVAEKPRCKNQCALTASGKRFHARRPRERLAKRCYGLRRNARSARTSINAENIFHDTQYYRNGPVTLRKRVGFVGVSRSMGASSLYSNCPPNIGGRSQTRQWSLQMGQLPSDRRYLEDKEPTAGIRSASTSCIEFFGALGRTAPKFWETGNRALSILKAAF